MTDLERIARAISLQDHTGHTADVIWSDPAHSGYRNFYLAAARAAVAEMQVIWGEKHMADNTETFSGLAKT